MEKQHMISFSKKYMDLFAPDIETNLRDLDNITGVYSFTSNKELVFNLIQKRGKKVVLVVHDHLCDSMMDIFGDYDFMDDLIKTWFYENYNITVEIIQYGGSIYNHVRKC